MNVGVIVYALKQEAQDLAKTRAGSALEPEYTIIENLDYFHIRDGVPQMSLTAIKMKALQQEEADFDEPRGVYNYQAKNKTLRYQGQHGTYRKAKATMLLVGDVKVISDESEYYADRLKYFFNKDLIVGTGNVKFLGNDLKTKDQLNIKSETMRAYPQSQNSTFKGKVNGFIQRKKQYEGRMTFSTDVLSLKGHESLAHLEGNVVMDRQSYHITSGKADVFLENFNKSLKYFVLNDDVKLTETLRTPEGVTQRKAFSERLEGFGREEKMVLSGAPRVEQGTDVVKGYRITVRENVDLIEVDDAMSDMQVKRKKN